MREKDPFLQRREERQKKIRKKRIKRTLISLLIICVITGTVLCLTVLFPIKKVTASGSEIYSEAEIVKAAGLTGKNLFTVSEAKTADKIRKRLPFTESVTINRRLPDTVTLKVKDAAEYAYYVCGDKMFTVSQKGYVLKECAEEPVGLIKIVTASAKCKAGEKISFENAAEQENITMLLNTLSEKGITVNSLDLSNSVALKARVEDRFDVNFGTSTNLPKKISHLRGMINSIGEGRKGSIDLSMWSPQKSEGSFTQQE